MDRIFDAKDYENWLHSRSGRNYLTASNNLLDHLLDCRPGARVLDIGCGLGSHLEHLRSKRLLTSGVEASPLLRHQAKARLGEKSDIVLGDAYNLPFEDNSFDAVLMVNSLEYMDRPALALAEAARVSCGRLCVITFNTWSVNRLTLNPKMRPLQFMGLLRLHRLLRQVLGPVPKTWRTASLGASNWVSHLPFLGLAGVCAAVSPRFMTTPLTLEVENKMPGISRARAVSLRVVK